MVHSKSICRSVLHKLLTIFSYAKDQGLPGTIQLLEEFISDSQHRLALEDPDYHSFDEEEWNGNNVLAKIFIVITHSCKEVYPQCSSLARGNM